MLEPAERVATERSEEPAFVPLSADVAPQMTLFGPPPTAPRPPIARPGGARAPSDGADADERPAFERRAQLRGERHRLVSDVRAGTGPSHREINAWLNQSSGSRASRTRRSSSSSARSSSS